MTRDDDEIRTIKCPECKTFALEVEQLSEEEKKGDCIKWGHCTRCGKSFKANWHKEVLSDSVDKQVVTLLILPNDC